MAIYPYPRLIRLAERQAPSCTMQPLRVKLDPGRRSAGLALVRDTEHVDPFIREVQHCAAVLNLFELVHRGLQISEALSGHRAMCRRRRVNLHYSAPRFMIQTNSADWLAPSLLHQVGTAMAVIGSHHGCLPPDGALRHRGARESWDHQGEYERSALTAFEVHE